REIDELKQRSKRWSRLAAEATDVNNQLIDIERMLQDKERQSRLVEIAMQISERWQSRRLVNEQIRAFGKLPSEKEIQIPELEALNQKILHQRERIEQIRSQRKTIKAEAMALPINRNLWSQKSRIEAVTEHMPWVESLQRQAFKLGEEIDTIENSMIGEVDGLGTQLKIKAKDVLDLGNRGLISLETTGKTLQDQKDRLAKFKGELDKVEFDLGQHQDRLGSNLAEQGASETLEDTGRYVNRLRRRIELEEKIQKLNRSRQELERDVDSVVNEQVLPVEKLSIVGIIFIVGVFLFGLGLVDTLKGGDWIIQNAARQLGITFIFMGAIAGFIGMFLKYHWERLAKEELDDFRHQVEIVRQQLKRAKLERDEVERQLPATVVGQWELELQDAESRLMRLEELVPLENRVQSTRSVLEDLRRKITMQDREVKKADENWRASLRTAGLPEILEPHQLKEIMSRAERISTFHVRLDQFKTEKLEREKELVTLNSRIDSLVAETGMVFQSTDIVDRLMQLNKAINEQRAFVNTRKEFANKYKSLRSRMNKSKRELDRLLGQKNRMLTKVGADSEEEYREFSTKHDQRNKLFEKRENLTEQILAALGKNFQEEDLHQLLNAYGTTGLETHWEANQEEIDSIKSQQSKLHQQRGEFLQEVKRLGEDSRLDVANLELNAVNAEISQLQKDWQVLATTTQMLEMIRESYESKRQPETLREASSDLEKLTEGRYNRIWTRLVGEELLVDNAQAETIPVDKLSRGTREAIYLSLRMALVSAYARRGAVIPMVLDDVLVNFDGQRAKAAADLLCEFSRNGYQILMFTCHDHMRDMFQALGADVRILPRHKDVVESNAVPIQFQGQGYLPPSVTESDFQPQIASPMPTPAVVPMPQSIAAIDANRIPVEYINHSTTNVRFDLDEYDPELEYELSAVTTDQQSEIRLRHELVYVNENLGAPVDLSGNEDIWFEGDASRI
ncbi:MAG: hypothetical protein AAF623_07620, partial [Planctomycetota bacterium]